MHDNDGINGGGFNPLGSGHTAGIYIAGGATTMHFGHLVLSGNNTRPANGGGLRNLANQGGARFFSLGYSLSDGPAAPYNVATDIASTDPMLGSRDPIGNSVSLPPLTGSPVISAGDPAYNRCASRDQRGGQRVVGTIDIGAHEVNLDPPLPQIVSILWRGSSSVGVVVEGQPGTFWRLESSYDLTGWTLEEFFLCEGTDEIRVRLPFLYDGGHGFFRIVRP